MKKTIRASDLSDEKIKYRLDIDIPNKCPRCNCGIKPIYINSYVKKSDNIDTGTVFFLCPSCEKLFFAEYFGTIETYENKIIRTLVFPVSECITDFPNEICKLTPDFVKIYNQAEKAENHGLDEICGTGYRKALEFLIKDFAILTNKKEEESIKKMTLSKCINKYINDDNIKHLATASSWLGNDETHYVRKHDDYNVSDLKAFVNATETYIYLQLQCLQAKELTGKN